FIVGGPVGDFELLLCHGTVCVVGKMRDLILQLSKSSIYSTKPRALSIYAKSTTHRQDIDTLFLQIDNLRNIIRRNI
ncbi:hypothetical protein KAH88_22695, partial [Klebsiella quasipneumoniae]